VAARQQPQTYTLKAQNAETHKISYKIKVHKSASTV